MDATIQPESPSRRMARARIGFAYLGIDPSPRLLRLISRRLSKKDLPSGETLEAAVMDLLVREAYIGPYLIPGPYDKDAA